MESDRLAMAMFWDYRHYSAQSPSNANELLHSWLEADDYDKAYWRERAENVKRLTELE